MVPREIEILLIEDDEDDAELAIQTLQKHNLANNLLHINEGEKALDYLYTSGNCLPKIILLDLRMPKVDGIQILGRLKSDAEKKNIPVVVLLSSKEGRNYVESFQLKADSYIVKPLDIKKFFLAMTEIDMARKIAEASIVR